MYWCEPSLASWRLADSFRLSRPRLIGESGSPSICTTLESLTKTFCPQPTAQLSNYYSGEMLAPIGDETLPG